MLDGTPFGEADAVAATVAMGVAAATDNKNRRETAPGVVRLSSAIDVVLS
jgi:hypothetical protein